MFPINEQFAAASRQFVQTAAQVNRLALSHAEQVFALQLGAFEQSVSAAFAHLGELAEVRDADGLRQVWPKGLQVARETAERAVSTGQEVLDRTVKAGEAIGQVARSQFEAATAQVQAGAEQVAKAAKAAKAK
ncbi:MAG TPA: phasin family protein [Xanthomonadaceae bacterium]|nr:phasin family protein [Xanthomonadaceae bacterium]